MKIFKHTRFFLFTLLLLPGLLKAVPDSLVYSLDQEMEGVNISLNGTNLNFSLPKENYDYWFFTTKDSYRNALKDIADWDWSRVPCNVGSYEDSLFKGFGWFRLHYRVGKKLAGTTLMLRLNHFGASEIFNDGKFLASFGVASPKPEEEICINPGGEFFPVFVPDTLEHVLAVRYSNHKYAENDDKYNAVLAGFILKMFSKERMLEISQLAETQRYFFISISFFLIALAFVHMIIFCFERSRKFNLFHSFFVLSLGLVFLIPVINHIVEKPETSFKIYYYTNFLVPTLLFSALALLYNLFQRKLNKFFYISLAFYVATLIMAYVFDNISGIFYITLFFNVFIGATILSIKGIRQNFRGAKIVGIGVLGVTICMIISILGLIVLKDNGLVFSVIMLILGILSLPLSMSVYLAFDFAGANKTLKQQIVQIEDLSAKALQKEQEKKQILESQNQVLEEQVKHRTAEIAKQNAVLENQKKEITDSITYAKRIQQSILPAIEDFKAVIPKSFVLYMPKDIVSGDFYYLRPSGKNIFVAAADCTGHGVPGALMSMVAHEKLEEAVTQSQNPGEILSLLNKGVKRTLKQNSGDNSTRDGCDIILVGINENKLVYSGANRNLCIIRKNAKEVEEIKATKCAIGGLTPEDQVYSQQELKMNAGDCVYLYSDGYADQFGGDKEKKLTTRKFKELLLSVQELSMEDQGKYLKDFNISWRDELEQIDDILVIGIRF